MRAFPTLAASSLHLFPLFSCKHSLLLGAPLWCYYFFLYSSFLSLSLYFRCNSCFLNIKLLFFSKANAFVSFHMGPTYFVLFL